MDEDKGDGPKHGEQWQKNVVSTVTAFGMQERSRLARTENHWGGGDTKL